MSSSLWRRCYISKFFSYLVKLLWFVGLVFVVPFLVHLQSIVQARQHQTMNVVPYVFQILLIGVGLGIYIGLIFISKRGLKINGPILLCAWLPSFLLASYLPAVFGAEMMLGHHHLQAPMTMWFLTATSYDFIQIVAGVTLMAGLFTGKTER